MPEFEMNAVDNDGNEWIIVEHTFEGATDVSGANGLAADRPAKYSLHDTRGHFRANLTAKDDGSFVTATGEVYREA
jgi:hypothetical protein